MLAFAQRCHEYRNRVGCPDQRPFDATSVLPLTAEPWMRGALRFRGTCEELADEPPTNSAPKARNVRLAARRAAGRRFNTGKPRCRGRPI
jgi:hypothetical protein